MKIVDLDLNNNQHKKLFKQFPFKLYQNTPNWVPNFDSEINLILNPKKHPYYKHSTAKFFFAKSENSILGRIAAIHNQNYANFHKKSVGFFYYFESINDKQVSSALFSAALTWLKSRGVKEIIGPKGFMRSNGVGLLISGFQHLPAVGIPYNFAYYQDLIESFGFEKLNDHFSGYLYAENKLPDKLHQIADKVKDKGNFWIKTFPKKKEMVPWIKKVDDVHHQAFHDNPNYFPSTTAEFALLANNIRQIANPKLIKLIMHKDQTAGFIISYANISQAIQQSQGKLFPWGWSYLAQAMKKTDLVDINGVGLLPAYQGRGANALLYSELEKTLRSFHTKKAELIQIDERNFRSKSDMEFLGVDWQKIHRTYQRVID